MHKTVRLRNLNLNGIDTGLVGIRITGGSVIPAGVAFIEDCLIDGVFASSAAAIFDERTAGGKLFISNTTVRNTGSDGIVISPGGRHGGWGADRCCARQRAYSECARRCRRYQQRPNRSIVAGNSVVGLFALGSLAATEVNVSNSVISSNDTGVQNSGGTVIIRLANNDITLNSTALSGATQSYGRNRLQGNGAAGTAPTPIGQQ